MFAVNLYLINKQESWAILSISRCLYTSFTKHYGMEITDSVYIDEETYQKKEKKRN